MKEKMLLMRWTTDTGVVMMLNAKQVTMIEFENLLLSRQQKMQYTLVVYL